MEEKFVFDFINPVLVARNARLVKLVITYIYGLKKEWVYAGAMSKLKFLDAGCRRGISLRLMLEAGIRPSNAFGIDIDPDAISQARAMSAVGVDYRVESMAHLSFDDSFFDIIFANEVFMYMNNEEVVEASRELRRVINTSGLLFSVNGDTDLILPEGSDGRVKRNFNFQTNELQELISAEFKELCRLNFYPGGEQLKKLPQHISSMGEIEYKMDRNQLKGNYLLSVFKPN